MIVAISGKIGSGKDAVASMIQQFQPTKRWEIKKYAFKIKQTVAMLTGCLPHQLEDQEFKKRIIGPDWGNMTYREMLQKVGTEAMRDNVHQNTWVNALFADYRPNQNWLITDCRFPNEADAVKKRGGMLIRINRNVSTGDHPSETALDDYKGWDFVISNTGTLEELRNNAEAVASLLCEPFDIET